MNAIKTNANGRKSSLGNKIVEINTDLNTGLLLVIAKYRFQ